MSNSNKTTNSTNLDQADLARIGKALYGPRWQTDIARDLGLSDGRRVRQWLAGDLKIPAGIWTDLDAIIRQRAATLDSLLAGELRLETYQAVAITRMARTLHDYNRGVLTMLGEGDLADEHATAAANAELYGKWRDEAAEKAAPGRDWTDPLPTSAEAFAARAVREAAREGAAWERIEAIISEARAVLADDPAYQQEMADNAHP